MKNYDDMLSAFMQYQRVTDGRTDGETDRQTNRIAISISRVSVLTRAKNLAHVFRMLIIYIFIYFLLF